ncbi:MAG: hypothetical protein ACK5T0_02120 [Vampirovibrionales bacterium]|jgi:hypothetical protein
MSLNLPAYLSNKLQRRNLESVMLNRMGFNPNKPDFYKAWLDFVPEKDIRSVTINAWRPAEEQIPSPHPHQVHFERTPQKDVLILTRDPEYKNISFPGNRMKASLVDPLGNPLTSSEEQIIPLLNPTIFKNNALDDLRVNDDESNAEALLFMNQASPHQDLNNASKSSVHIKDINGKQYRFSMTDRNMPQFLQNAFQNINKLIDQNSKN